MSLIYSMLGEVVSFSATPAVADRRGRRRGYGRTRRCMARQEQAHGALVSRAVFSDRWPGLKDIERAGFRRTLTWVGHRGFLSLFNMTGGIPPIITAFLTRLLP